MTGYSAKGKHGENLVCEQIRERTGWTEEQVHRNLEEQRSGEQGVGDVVVPAPVVLQVKMRNGATGWGALDGAEAAAAGAEGLYPWGVAIRTRGQGRKRWELVLMRRPVFTEVCELAGTGLLLLRLGGRGPMREYEGLREEADVGRWDEVGALAWEVPRRGTDERAVVMEATQAWEIMARAWAEGGGEDGDGR